MSKLVASGAISSWTIEEMQELVEEGKSAIVMEDGVFRIKEEVYDVATPGDHAVTTQPRSGELLEIAHEVVAHASPAEETTFMGIGDLFRDAEVFDLSTESPKQQTATSDETFATAKERTFAITFASNGIDYDDFLSGYPRAVGHTQQMRSLVEISRRVSAVSAGILMKVANGYEVELSVGLNEKSRQMMHLEAGDPLITQFLAKRKAVVIEKNPADVETWRVFIDQEDLRYMKRVVLIPLTFQSQDAYLLLAFASDKEINLKDVFSKLLIR